MSRFAVSVRASVMVPARTKSPSAPATRPDAVRYSCATCSSTCGSFGASYVGAVERALGS